MTLGKIPYEEIEPEDMLSHLTAGHRLTQPKNCPDEISFRLLPNLWNFNHYWTWPGYNRQPLPLPSHFLPLVFYPSLPPFPSPGLCRFVLMGWCWALTPEDRPKFSHLTSSMMISALKLSYFWLLSHCSQSIFHLYPCGCFK